MIKIAMDRKADPLIREQAIRSKDMAFQQNQPSDQLPETITLGGGCFWCLEAVYSELAGVTKVVSGYSGGKLPHPSYDLVCTGMTGHAEVVQLQYDPGQISTREILEVFFSIHDPTTLNRQGADVGTQYRSIILYDTSEQKNIAQKLIYELERDKVWNQPIVTEIQPFAVFYPAEAYHQHYFARNPWQGYCQAVISPKMAKFRRKFAKRLKVAEVLGETKPK